MAAPLVDLPPRPGLRREGRAACSTSTRACSRASGCGPTSTSISADEKSQLQALGRRHETSRARRPAARSRYEFEYERGGTLAYLAAWDVHHANLFDRVEEKTGIDPFGRLVEQVMTTEPYASASTVYWIVDNGSSHAGRTRDPADAGPLAEHPADPPPVHASWLNQIELYFSILQRKALTPNDLQRSTRSPSGCWPSAQHYRQIARPFEWTFTRHDLNALMDRIDRHEPQLALAA